MKFCVIGLGRFGYQVATVLSENGMEVLAIDSNESIVASIRDSVAHAIVMNVTDEASLRSVGVDEIDTVIVAMGEDSTESILITALLKKHLKTPYVITRAIDDLNKEILSLVGADRVILPEPRLQIDRSHLGDLQPVTQPIAIVRARIAGAAGDRNPGWNRQAQQTNKRKKPPHESSPPRLVEPRNGLSKYVRNMG